MVNRTLFVSLFTAVILCFASCRKEHKYVSSDGAMLGTTFHISADIKSGREADLYQAAMRVDTLMKASMSIFDSTSLLSRVNRNETDSVDAHITYNFKIAGDVWRVSNGAYDVTVKPLVEAWGFAGKQGLEDPNVDSILEFVGYEKVRIANGQIIKDDPRIQLDFNSIAKGYTVDVVAHELERLGAQNYIVEIGGEVRCRGVNAEGNAWRVGVETPFDGNMSEGQYLQKRIQLSEGGLATSGNYRRFHIDKQGRKVAHTISPKTGRSAVSRLLSATVVAPTCTLADAYGTMFMALGADAALAMAEKMDSVKVYLILSNDEGGYDEYFSPDMKKLIMNE